MKKILIDLYKTNDLYSGLGQYSLNFAKELQRAVSQNIKLDFLIPGKGFLEHLNPSPNIHLSQANFQKRYLPSLNKNYALWHSLHQFPSHLPNGKTPQMLTIHDLNFLVEKEGAKQAAYLKKLQKNVDRADHITAISEYTKKEIEAHINLKGKKIEVIYNGVPSPPAQTGERPDFLKHDFLKPGDAFFMSIGIFSPKKNFGVLVDMMKHFENRKLLIAGNCDTPYGREIKDRIEKEGVADRVFLPGKISELNKQWLYKHCEAFLFPSLAEGFGIPPIEAMQFGKPVFLSRLTCLPEIGGDEAFYFDGFGAEYMAGFVREKLAEFESDKAFREEKTKERAGRFTWQASVGKYVRLYQEILGLL